MKKETILGSIYVGFSSTGVPEQMRIQCIERVTDPETGEIYREGLVPARRFDPATATLEERASLDAALGLITTDALARAVAAEIQVEELLSAQGQMAELQNQLTQIGQELSVSQEVGAQLALQVEDLTAQLKHMMESPPADSIPLQLPAP